MYRASPGGMQKPPSDLATKSTLGSRLTLALVVDFQGELNTLERRVAYREARVGAARNKQSQDKAEAAEDLEHLEARPRAHTVSPAI